MANKLHKMETRIFKCLDMRALGKDGKPTQIIGYAVKFNDQWHGEMIAPGAFKKTLSEKPDIRAYWQHDRAKPLGRTVNDTLTLKADKIGLYVEITPNLETSWGRDALASVARGDVNQFSFGFMPVNTENKKVDGEDVSIIKEAILYEVSPVSEPWYESTVAEARDSARVDDVSTDAPEPGGSHSTIRQAEAARIERAGAMVAADIIQNNNLE